MDDSNRVRRAIWEHVPELRGSFVEYERKSVQDDLERGIEPYVGAYELVTDVFVRPYLLPLLDDADSDEAAIERCARAVEYLLEAHSSYLDDLVGIRIVEPMLYEPERWRRMRQHAGPLLKEYVRNDIEQQYFTWPYDEPVV